MYEPFSKSMYKYENIVTTGLKMYTSKLANVQVEISATGKFD